MEDNKNLFSVFAENRFFYFDDKNRLLFEIYRLISSIDIIDEISLF